MTIDSRNGGAALLAWDASLLESIPASVFALGPTGTVLSVSQLGAERLGYPAQELVERSFFSLFHAEDQQSVRAALTLSTPVIDGEFRQLRQDGSVLWVKLLTHFLPKGQDDSGLLVVTEDLTECKRLQATLQERTELLQIVTNEIQAKVSYVDAQQRYQFINRQYQDWYETPIEQLLGKTVKELMGESDYQKIQASIESVLAGERVDYEFTGSFNDGEERRLAVSYVPHTEETGAVLGFFVVCLDVTERQ